MAHHIVDRIVRPLVPVAKLGLRRLQGRKSPFQMTLSLTNRCNFRCEYCHIPAQARDELTTTEWCAAIDDLIAGGMGRVSLIGGEPLLRDDVGEIIGHLKSRGVHVAMNSNGWLVPARIEQLAGVDLVCLTLDGTAEVHDRQRHRGSYERVIQAIGMLSARGVPVVTMTVLTPSSAHTMEHVLEVARRFGIRAYFQLEHDADVDVRLPLAPRIDDEGVEALLARLLRLKEDGWPVGNSRPILTAQRDARYIGTCADCHAGRYYGYVFSDGTVAPCLLTQAQVPRENGRRQGFARAFEQLAPPEGPGCSCAPTHEVNRILDFDPRVLFAAVDMARKPSPSTARG